MSIGFPLSSFSSTYICLLLVGVLFHSCFSTQNLDDVLCLDYERQALAEFKHGLIDEAGRLNSWASEEKDCCKLDGIVCDNFMGHAHQIHLRAVDGHCLGSDYNTATELDEIFRWRLRGNISPSILNLKQLKHLDLSYNDFRGIRIPTFMGSIGNLRYLNLSHSRFGGSVPPQLGNLSELVILCLETFTKDPLVRTRMMNMQWLSSLYMLRHLDLSGVDLSKSVDWLQVINTLPSSLVQLHLSRNRLPYMHPQVASPNLTSLSLLNLSGNRFNDSSMFVWIFSITSLVSLDLSECGFQDPFPNSIYSFHNLISLKFLYMSGNNLMNLSSVLKRLSTIASNLVYLDASDCDVSSSVLGSLHNLTSLLSLDLAFNMLDNTIPTSVGNLCNLRDLDLGYNHFSNISLERLLEGFFECESPRLESLSLQSSGLSSHLPNKLGQLIHLVHLQMRENRIAGIIPDSIGRLSFLRSLQLDKNLISGPFPFSIAGLSSLEVLSISDNRVNGNIPVSLGLLSKLSTLDITNNLLTGTMTEAHFSNLTGLKVLLGIGNNMTLRPHLVKWKPPFQLQFLYLSYWDLGPQFPLWLQSQRDLIDLVISNMRISSTIPDLFLTSFPNLQILDMSRNNIQGRLFGLPASLIELDLSSNLFSGQLPKFSDSSMAVSLDLSNNSFTGSLHHLLCPYGGESLLVLNLANNHLSGVIPECWGKMSSLYLLNLENNNFSGGIPRTLGFLSSLGSLNMCDNKLSGRLPTSLKNMTELAILQLVRNELC